MALFTLYYFPWLTFLIYIFQEILNTTYLSIGIKITQDCYFDLFSMNLVYGGMYSSSFKWVFVSFSLQFRDHFYYFSLKITHFILLLFFIIYSSVSLFSGLVFIIFVSYTFNFHWDKFLPCSVVCFVILCVDQGGLEASEVLFMSLILRLWPCATVPQVYIW